MVIVGAVILAASFLATRAQMGLQGLRAVWVSVAVIVFNTVLGFVLLNLAVAVGLRLTDAAEVTRRSEAGIDSPVMRIPLVRLSHLAGRRPERVLALRDDQLASIYPGWTRRQVKDLLAEGWERSLRFPPFAEFQEKPFRGRYVNVVEPGLRLIRHPGPWSMAARVHNDVWVFGGSTTFGYGPGGLGDDPLASRRACAGAGPARRSESTTAGAGPLALDGPPDPRRQPVAPPRRGRGSARRQAPFRLAAVAGLEVRPSSSSFRDGRARPFLPLRSPGSAADGGAGGLGRDFLWLGDLQLGEMCPLYVDRLHYTSAFAREIAERVADRIQQGL